MQKHAILCSIYEMGLARMFGIVMSGFSWIFSGATKADWKAKESEPAGIKNKPFETLGNGLTVSETGELSVTISADDIGAQKKLVAGNGIVIDETNPKAPVLSVKPTEILDQTFDLNLGHGYINVRQRNGVVLLNLVIMDAVYQPNTKIYANGDIDDLMRQLFDNPLLERRLERINVYNLQNKTAPNIDSYLIEFSNDGIVFVNDNEVTFQQDELAMITLTMFTG